MQRSPKRAQLVAKIAQNTPHHEPPTRPPNPPICGQNTIVTLIFTLRPFLRRSFPRPPKMPKMPPNRPQDGQIIPILGHLGANLAASWRQVRPSCCHFGPPAPVQNQPKSAKTASWPFFFPRSPPRAPRHPPGIDFLAFRVDFSNFLGRFSLDFRFHFQPFSMDFQRELTAKAKLERKGPAVLAAGVFDYPPAPGHGRDRI